MAQTTPLPKFTECFAPAPRPVSLNDRRITQALFAFLLLAVLCVAHVYLRFSIRDLKMQQHRQQELHRALLQRENQLRHESETLCDSSRLREYARRELKMVETDPRTQLVASVPTSLRDKYLGNDPAVAPRATMIASAIRAIPMEAQKAEPIQKFLLSLVEANQAFAAGNSR